MSVAGPPDAVAILAGSGTLPLLLADRLAAAGRTSRIIAFRGFADRGVTRRAERVCDLLDVRAAIACLERWRPAAVTLAGGVRRPTAAAALGAFAAFRNRREIARLMARGDDDLLRGIVALIEEQGHRLLGVLDLAPDLLAPEGIYGRHQPTEADLESARHGAKLLAALSPFDVGQAAVVDGRRVLAVEGPEGTDRAIDRVGRGRGLLPRLRGARPGGVLIKAPKGGQDLRVDLPAIGPRTVARAARAGLRGIAVASGLTLVLDRDETVRVADRLGLFVFGMDAGEAP